MARGTEGSEVVEGPGLATFFDRRDVVYVGGDRSALFAEWISTQLLIAGELPALGAVDGPTWAAVRFPVPFGGMGFTATPVDRELRAERD